MDNNICKKLFIIKKLHLTNIPRQHSVENNLNNNQMSYLQNVKSFQLHVVQFSKSFVQFQQQ